METRNHARFGSPPTPESPASLRSVFEALKRQSFVQRSDSASDRLKRLNQLHQAVVQHEAQIIEAMQADFQKPATEVVLTELVPFYTEIKHQRRHLKQWMRPRRVSSSITTLAGRSWVQTEPRGTCLILAPWNYPFNLSAIPLATALAAGNTILLKPSELAPHTSSLIAQMVSSCLPTEVATVVEGDADTARALLELPFDHIFFTGSTRVGKLVMEAASRHLSSVTLELGGKSPAYVDESADLSDTARKLVWGKWINAGQTCIAPDYVLVNHRMMSALLDALRTASEAFGAVEETGDHFCAMVSDKHAQRMQELVESSVAAGARVEWGGTLIPNTRRMQPTVITRVRRDMPVMQEEIFGPILPIVGIEHLDEAIEFINADAKPLALYVFSRNPHKTDEILRRTSAGNCCVNDVIVQISNPNLPFGGVNHSGMGHYHGEAGFLTFSHQKSIYRQPLWLNMNRFLYPPYTDQKSRLARWLMGWLR
ncbi:MAG: aldehyde dehydrogenase family protein [Sphingomonadales bacterium]|nr:aldehyde dehydrogenase family protein [Sphingomonadales bacterium]